MVIKTACRQIARLPFRTYIIRVTRVASLGTALDRPFSIARDCVVFVSGPIIIATQYKLDLLIEILLDS